MSGLKTPMKGPENRRGAFYVGYLPVPRSLVRFLYVAVPVLAAGVVGASLLASRSQGDPGTGKWDTSGLTAIEGIYQAKPYPMLLIMEAGGKQIKETVLLVEEGKHGAQQRNGGLSGLRATARGSLITRDGVRMLELAPGEQGLLKASSQPAAGGFDISNLIAGSSATSLRGEIIDPKCGLGVMRPGQGRTHKECAIRCISGGIPPVLVTTDSKGSPVYYLLTDAKGEPVNQLVLPYIAEPVEISGLVLPMGNLQLLRIDADGIKIL